MLGYFGKKQEILLNPKIDINTLKTISIFKDQFLQKSQDLEITPLLESEIAASWQRSKKMGIDPLMQELFYVLNSQELKALLQDKKKFIELAKYYFYSLLPLLNIPAAICIQNECGTILDLYDEHKLLRLNLRKGSIWREETVGTSSTSLCIEHEKAVQLAGSQHYCKMLEHQLATTIPIYNSQGDRLGLITVVHCINESILNAETLQKIALWTNALCFMVESQLELRQRNYIINNDNLLSAGKKGESFSAKLDKENGHSPSEKKPRTESFFSNVIGESTPIKNVVTEARRFAQTDCGILLIGESGTGKDLFAREIHRASRRNGPFVAINCAGIPSNLIASELFGYVGGAFTGAEQKGRQGKIELAQNGTLFLDEIGDMPLEVQPNLLRVLEEKKVMRLGSNKEIHVDFRLIAATNKDLFQLVQEKKFREDLYYRLDILQLLLPPLRQLGHDILLMANYFLEEACKKIKRRPLKLHEETEKFMLDYFWPGNVRQLKNAMTYAANVCQGDVVMPHDLPASLYRNIEMPLANQKAETVKPLPSLQETEQEEIRKALLLTKNNVRAAAKMLGLSKTSVYRKVKKYGIDL